MVASLYLMRAIVNVNPRVEVRLFEGFVSFKETGKKSNHSRDVELLREVVENPTQHPGAIIAPEALKMNESDKLESAFWVAGIDTGIPPIIMRSG